MICLAKVTRKTNSRSAVGRFSSRAELTRHKKEPVGTRDILLSRSLIYPLSPSLSLKASHGLTAVLAVISPLFVRFYTRREAIFPPEKLLRFPFTPPTLSQSLVPERGFQIPCRVLTRIFKHSHSRVASFSLRSKQGEISGAVTGHVMQSA